MASTFPLLSSRILVAVIKSHPRQELEPLFMKIIWPKRNLYWKVTVEDPTIKQCFHLITFL